MNNQNLISILIGEKNLLMIDFRIQNFPQLKDYDNMEGTRYLPFAQLAGPVSFSSNIINTDSRGFRKTKFNKKYISTDSFEKDMPVNIVIGSSTAFGIGASNDDNTISSNLSKLSGKQWLNLGVRACVSIHEIIHLLQLLPRFHKVENVVVFSGINDIYINFLKHQPSELDARFDESHSNRILYPPSRVLVCEFLSKIYRCNSSELLPLSKKKIFSFPFSRSKKDVNKNLENTVEDKLNILRDIHLRNFFIYSALQKQLKAKFLFCLQPFFPWTNKIPTETEKNIFDQLMNIQKYSNFVKIKDIIGKPEICSKYENIIQTASNLYEIEYLNLNDFCKVQDTIFCDQVHLVDKGYSMVSEIIIGKT